MTSWRLQIAALVGIVVAQPANDNCIDAVPIGDGVVFADTNSATVEANLTRNFSPCNAYNNDVWFSYSASCSGMATATVTGACDLVLATWGGDCSHFDTRSCEDLGGANQGETLLFRVVEGSSYLISVADYSPTCSGAVSLNLTCTQALPNDLCESAQEVVDGYNGGLTNMGATVVNSTAHNPCGTAYHHDVWFVYNATCTGKADFRITNQRSDLVVVSWAGTSCGSLTGLTCGDTGHIHEPDHVVVATVEGTMVHVSVAGFTIYDFADFDMSIICVATPPVPAHDECANAKVINGDGVTSSSLFGATRSANTTTACSSDADVWFRYVAPCTGIASLSVTPACATDDITLQLWSGNGSGICPGAVANPCIDKGTPSESKKFFVAEGLSYLFLVGSKLADPYSGDFTITASCAQTPPPPDNDQCVGAYSVVDGPNNAANMGATATPSHNTGCTSVLNSDVWFRYQATCSGVATATLSHENDEALVAWRGNNCSNLVSHQCTHNGPVTFPTIENQTYYISAGSFDIYQGPLLLTLSCNEAGTLAPTGAPTSNGQVGRNETACPDFVPLLANCSATNFTDNAQCSASCASTVPHIFAGTNLTLSQKVECLTIVNAAWSSAAADVLSQRLTTGSPLCRSTGIRAIMNWVVVALGLSVLL